ncbi:MAG: sigma-70 family RNA polymerase sigma factor [Saprospiraceae bacterium]
MAETSSSTIDQLSNDLFRQESGKIISVLTKIFGVRQLEVAEDIVQDTFLSAIRHWRANGLPDNPPAWLMQVAKNKAIDTMRSKKPIVDIDISDQQKALLQSGYTFVPTFDKIWDQINIEDEMLQMMFACCHEGISQESQVTLMLKILGGFSTAEISRAFLTSEDTISKRLYRAKEFFRAHNIRLQSSENIDYPARIDAVLKAIYLLFNEGYLSTDSDQSIRQDLIHQAIYLGSILTEHPKTKNAMLYAAMALMCFHAARISSRLDESGDIILLSHQDRSLWSLPMIARGMSYLDQSAEGEEITSYHLEAAIAYEHCIAPSFEKTDWKKILQYYDWLESIQPNPMVSLNRLVAFSKCHDLSTTMEALNQSNHLQAWSIQPVYYALLGDLLADTNPDLARTHYQKAAEITKSAAEKKLMYKKMDSLVSF